MKKVILALFLLAMAPSVLAQADVCIGAVCKTATAAQVTKNNTGKLLDNAALCLAKGAAGGKNCTQAQLNAVPGCAAGACGTIYPATGTGDSNYGLDSMFACHFDRLDSKLQEINLRDLVAQSIPNGSTIASNTECANAVGGTLGNGCTRFQIACRALSGGTSSDCK